VASPWLIGLIGAPAASSAILVIARRRFSPATSRRWVSATAAAALLCAGMLAWRGGRGETLLDVGEWLPGTGAIAFSLGVGGLYALIVMVACALLAHLSTQSAVPPLSTALSTLSLAAAGVAFLTDHFLARYVALEVAALCVSLAPLAERQDPESTRSTWMTFLALRLGDAGLLAAILILMKASGSLDIDTALAAGQTLGPVRLGWAAAGLAVAVWVKLGGWPFYLWTQPGLRLSAATRAWLHATLMPGLGMYLLYRVTPLLVRSAPLRSAALWVGASGALLAMLMALPQANLRTALVRYGAAQGGLTLFAAASGAGGAAWLSLVICLPLRLLIYAAIERAEHAHTPLQRRLAALLIGVGGGAYTAFCLLLTWWARQGDVPLGALLVAEAAVALSGVWVARATARCASARAPGPADRPAVRQWAQWGTAAMLGGAIVPGGLCFAAVVRWLSGTAGLALLDVPGPGALVRYVTMAPTLVIALALALAFWLLRTLHVVPMRGTAQALSAVQAKAEAYVVRAVARAPLDGARAMHNAIERGLLEGGLWRVGQGIMGGALIAYRLLEQGGLEELLRCVVRGTLAAVRRIQHWHTGRLRHNLAWIALSLGLALLGALLLAW